MIKGSDGMDEVMSCENTPGENGAFRLATIALDVKRPSRSLERAYEICRDAHKNNPACRYLYALFLYTGTCAPKDTAAAREEMSNAVEYRPAEIVAAEFASNADDVMAPLIELRFLAEQRDTVACRKIFPLYDTGKNPNGLKAPVKKDHAEAVRLYMPCADDGDIEAQNIIGYMYLMGKGVEKDAGMAISLLSEAAGHGCSEAAYRLGYMYDSGQCGQEPDLDKAIEWYVRAADLGHAGANYQLASIFFMRQGRWFNASRAQKYLIKAADGDNKEGMRELGTMYACGSNGFRKDPEKAVYYLERACEAGDQQAMLTLANLSFEGQLVPQSFAKAAKWFSKAAEECNGTAQYALGCMYGNGFYFPQDDKKAAQFFQDAAEGGEPNAQYALACICYEGRGIPKDLKKAASWFQEAAGQGHLGAMAFFGMFKVTGKEVDCDVEGGLKMLKTAADNGYRDAQFYLGKLYAEGQYVARDVPYAKRMLSLAAKQNDPDAIAMLAKIKENKI